MAINSFHSTVRIALLCSFVGIIHSKRTEHTINSKVVCPLLSRPVMRLPDERLSCQGMDHRGASPFKLSLRLPRTSAPVWRPDCGRLMGVCSLAVGQPTTRWLDCGSTLEFQAFRQDINEYLSLAWRAVPCFYCSKLTCNAVGGSR